MQVVPCFSKAKKRPGLANTSFTSDGAAAEHLAALTPLFPNLMTLEFNQKTKVGSLPIGKDRYSISFISFGVANQ
ncbi:hypothetical protein [Advenella sp. FME57]|uniref:hypothetical protein n=1 Tax=Advenella sp. FME57 TaxID=2742604 RepID=UPI00186927DF|nr:hypothetical protein [Advenella sp. FME57]